MATFCWGSCTAGYPDPTIPGPLLSIMMLARARARNPSSSVEQLIPRNLFEILFSDKAR